MNYSTLDKNIFLFHNTVNQMYMYPYVDTISLMQKHTKCVVCVPFYSLNWPWSQGITSTRLNSQTRVVIIY